MIYAIRLVGFNKDTIKALWISDVIKRLNPVGHPRRRNPIQLYDFRIPLCALKITLKDFESTVPLQM